MVETLKVFVGIKPKQWLPSEVLRFSIGRRTKAVLEYHELTHLPPELQVPPEVEADLYRFLVPELCAYQGKALYLDADSLVLCDLLELLHYSMGEKGALVRPIHSEEAGACYTSIMLLNNAKLRHWKLSHWWLKMQLDRQIYRDTLSAGPKGLATADFGPLPKAFNEQDQYDADTKIIHFAQQPTQPWKQPGHPHAALFLKELKAAIEAEEIPIDALLREISYGHIYPAILQDLAIA